MAATSETGQTERPTLGRDATPRDRFRYRFDAAISRGTGVVILWMLALVLATAVVAGLLIILLRVGYGDDKSFLEGAWQSLNRTFDPGTLSGDAGWRLRVVALFMTLLGLLFVASLIGLIGAAIDGRIEELRKGRSFVVEQGHTLILGWSPRIFTVISELVIANENHPGSAIVVLSTEDKTEMEDEIRERSGDPGTTRIVCRTGDPASINNLALVNAASARSIIILAENSRAGDAEAVKAVLAVMSGETEGDPAPIVTEMYDSDTAEALADAGAGRVVPVRSADVVARVTAQACRQSGLSYVFQELLDFDGDEIYFQPAPELVGHTFGEAVLAYDTSSVIGRYTAAGEVQVNPPTDTRFEEGDSVIAVSEDDDTVIFSGFKDLPTAGPNGDDPVLGEEALLIVGWNPLGPLILRQLDQFVTPGSTADVLVHTGSYGEREDGDVGVPALDHLTVDVRHIAGDVSEFAGLVVAKPYDSVILLGYRDVMSPAEADARTLLHLLLLNRALGPASRRPRIVTELLDARDVELAVVTGADDFVVSDALSSLMIAQLSERAELDLVFKDLFDSDGAAVQMRPARRYAPAGPRAYAEYVAAAVARSEVPLGYRQGNGPGAVVVVNPDRPATVDLADDDFVIVIGNT